MRPKNSNEKKKYDNNNNKELCPDSPREVVGLVLMIIMIIMLFV